MKGKEKKISEKESEWNKEGKKRKEKMITEKRKWMK